MHISRHFGRGTARENLNFLFAKSHSCTLKYSQRHTQILTHASTPKLNGLTCKILDAWGVCVAVAAETLV